MSDLYTHSYNRMASAKNVRETGLDKFYTNQDVAKKCLDKIEEIYGWDLWDLIIEPSAGNGSFLLQIPSKNKIGIDISPEHDSIIKQDFLKYKPESNNRILVVGNPPFGKISSLAIKFFNHAAKFGHTISYIIPRTFRRVSVQNKLDLNFHLIHDEDISLKPCAFVPPMMVKCCFQIWEKREIKRLPIHMKTSHPSWEFLGFGPKDAKGQPTPPQGADFAIRAYGGKCGEIIQENLHLLRPKSWHWIKSNIDKNELVCKFKKLDYSISQDTARQNSIGRGELVNLYSKMFA